MTLKAKKILPTLLMIFIIIQPILDIYWLLEKPIISIAGVGISTIIRYSCILILSILSLFIIKSKKQYLFYIFYGILILIYTILHHISAINLSTFSSENFSYNIIRETIYIMRMTLPLIVIAISSNIKFSDKKLDKIVDWITILISGSIVLTNIFKISFGAYITKILSINIFDWFSSNSNMYSFYDTASRGYFSFANMISALLFGFTFVLIYRVFKHFNLKNSVLLFIQMIAMIMLGTKVSTYGFVISVLIMVIVYLFFVLVKKQERFSLISMFYIFLISALWFTIYPYSPCYNRVSDVVKIKSSIEEKTENNKSLTKNDAQIKKENNINKKEESMYDFLINNYSKFSIREDYIIDSYPVKDDPSFWYSILSVPVQSRIDNRYISERILKRIKEIDNRKIENNLFGVGYTRMTNMVYLERDFLSQYYTLGVLGVGLFLMPYIVIIIISGVYIIFTQKKFKFKYITLLMASGIGILSTYFCGNSLDSLTFTIIYGFILGQIINRIFCHQKIKINENKVTIMALHLGVGGVEKFLISLANMLSEKYEVEIIVSYKVIEKPIFKLNDKVQIKYLINDRPYKQEFLDSIKHFKVVDIFKYGFKNLKILLIKYNREADAIQNIDSKFVVTTIFHSKLVGSILNDKYIKIATEHNYHNSDRRYISKVVHSVENFNCLVCVSQELADFYKSKLTTCDSIYISNAIEKLPDIIEEKDRNSLISVGRLSKEKGFLDLIDVVSIVKKSIPDITINIVGDGNQKKVLQKKIDELDLNNNIKLVGRKNSSEINLMMQKSQLYIMTSYTESFGLVLIEAMSNKLPCMAFDCANGAKNLLCSKNGILIQNRNNKLMAKKIIYFLKHQDELNVYKKNGYDFCQQFLEENVKQDWFDLLGDYMKKEQKNLYKYFDRLYKDSKDSFYKLLRKDIVENEKKFIITANPETIMYGEKDKIINRMLLDSDNIIVPDGIGIVKAGRILGYDVEERITGVDIAQELLNICNELSKSLYLFGSKKEVINDMKKVIESNYPNIKLLGVIDGYIENKDRIMKDITKLKPDVTMIALGIPNQEKIIYKHLNEFQKGIFIGVGGSFDVISGNKKRAPKIFIKTNTEWLYRIICEPKRIKRFWNNNVKFLIRIKKEVRGNKK